MGGVWIAGNGQLLCAQTDRSAIAPLYFLARFAVAVNLDELGEVYVGAKCILNSIYVEAQAVRADLRAPLDA
jgi:hypothetical protein